MNLNELTRRTARYEPAIERHENGDVSIHWPLQLPGGNSLRVAWLANASGLDEELFARSVWNNRITLHVPAGVVG